MSNDKKINITFFGQLFFKGKKTGIAWSADNIVRELSKDDRLSLQMNYLSRGIDKDQETEVKIDYGTLGIKFNENNTITESKYKLKWLLMGTKYQSLFNNSTDINIFFNFVVPVGVKGKSIVVVHDMSYLDYPDTVRAKTKYWLKLTLRGSVKRADRIITVSEFTKERLIKLLNVPEQKISVMYNGVDLHKYNPDYTEEGVEEVKTKYGIKGDYLFYLGTIEPRKNLERLINAYYMAVDKMGESNIPDLILAGGKGWLSESIYQAAEKSVHNKKVRFLGYIESDEAPLLIKGARLFCFPSLYEGFGMPPLEAMACGTPVLTSNVSSLPEVCGDNAIYVDPLSETDICSKLISALSDETLLNRLSQKGVVMAKNYEWDETVKPLKKVIFDLAKQQ